MRSTARRRRPSRAAFVVRLDEVGWQVGRSAEDARLVLRRRDGEADDRGHAGARSTRRSSATRRATRASTRSSSSGLRDEPNLARWQAGLMRADGSVRTVVPIGAGGALGDRRKVRREDARRGGIRPPCMARRRPFRAGRRLPSADSLLGIHARRPARTRASGRASTACARAGDRARVLTERGRIEAHVTRSVRFPWRRLAPGRYVYSIRFRAEANRDRKTRLTSHRFSVQRLR